MSAGSDGLGDDFDQQVLAHVGLIRHIGSRSERTRRDLDDFTHTVLVAVWAGKKHVTYTDHLERWIARIAHNIVIDWNRKRQPTLSGDPFEVAAPVPPIDETLAVRDRWESVVAALSALDEDEQHLIRSRYLEDRSYEELQEQLGISQGAIRMRMTRAMGLLRRRLAIASVALAWLTARPQARAFGEVPRGTNRMTSAVSVVTSTLMIGWLGISAHEIEESAVDLAMLSARGDTFVPIAQLSGSMDAFRARVRPLAPLPDAGPRPVMAAPGLPAPVALTQNGAGDGEPVWSSDGQEVLFHTNRAGNYEIYIMDSDGGNQVRLTDNPEQDLFPTWSPDGQKIAFGRTQGGWANGDIYVMDRDGGNVTPIAVGPVFDWDPHWSPDGAQISFSSSRAGGRMEIFVMEPDGGGVRQLTRNGANSWGARWAPDGQQIVYFVENAIAIMDRDGGNEVRLAPNAYNDGPAWSPDGSRIAFSSGPEPVDTEIYVMDRDGSNLTRLTDTEARDRRPSWSPDGTQVAFESGAAEAEDIYVVDVSELLSTDEPTDEPAAVTPSGKRLTRWGDLKRR